MLRTLAVEGMAGGAIRLPLSLEDLDKLKAVSQPAPFGIGKRTLGDTSVRQPWQLDPSKISFPDNPEFLAKTAYDIASAALSSMGVHAGSLELGVKLYKMLLYEPGGHFKLHSDKEKEAGMFATMVIQLPTQTGHGGGGLTVRHLSCSKAFEFQSTSGYFYTTFFCHCERKLDEVTRGSRLCLVFSLVRKNTRFLGVDDSVFFTSALPRVQALMQAWASRSKGFRAKMVIPLCHKYSTKCLRFAGLRGHDRVVAALCGGCDFLELHLCTLTKLVQDPQHVDDDDRKHDDEHWIENWVSTEDHCKEFGRWPINIERDVLRCIGGDSREPFDKFPDEESFDKEGYGIYKHFYHVAVLVAWPKSKRYDAILSSCSSDEHSMVVPGLLKDATTAEDAKQEVHKLVVALVKWKPELLTAKGSMERSSWPECL
ncbi:hypothetical protein SELMODRAFT_402801 [Selaginella moellendorffii]|uniref:Prolyl 4-hydroxylase alpha subunit Fe(2+) 2OG dioxygenase domain-containing protein n=1 Tax=Selaginella moellendorffii TaxID=88036 RepID=D8QN35_SELML|nr:hypothetical protein SELMODRAFT_402801 [Selaginella moellendorffii]